jgi:hypothetical protein
MAVFWHGYLHASLDGDDAGKNQRKEMILVLSWEMGRNNLF